MWRTGREPNQRYNPRPYPTARPRIFVPPGTSRNKRRVAPKANPFANDPAASPADSPLQPNVFGTFHFELSNDARPNRYAPDRVDPVPPMPESDLKTPRFVRRPPKWAPVAPSAPKPSREIPGAFPAPDPVELVAESNPATGPTQGKQGGERKRCRTSDDSEISRLRKAVRREFGDGVLGEEEKMLLKQLNALHMNHNYRNHLFKCRDAMERASKRDQERAEKLARRDAVVEKLAEMESQVNERERRKREEEEQRRRREEIRRREQERIRKRREIEELERERLKRWVEELAERGRQQEQERLQREAREKEEAERRATEDAEAHRRIQENIRGARELFSSGDAGSIRRQFEEYEGSLIKPSFKLYNIIDEWTITQRNGRN
jgi:hypothetical protein